MKQQIDVWFIVAKLYSHVYGFFKDTFNIHIRGLGFILRKVSYDHLLLVNGRKLHFSRELAEAYVRPLQGQWNEPETHVLIAHLMNNMQITFVEVGANIGEIFIDVAAHPRCAKALAFEPNLHAVAVINKNIALNMLSNCMVINKALGHINTTQKMSFGSHSPTASLLSTDSLAGVGVDVEVSTLDSEIDSASHTTTNVVLLIDVEGYELNVVRGGRRLICDCNPLIIFEYHHETKKVFNLASLQHDLGDAYRIYRVTQNAMIDNDVENAWNCIAIPRNTQFESVLNARMTF